MIKLIPWLLIWLLLLSPNMSFARTKNVSLDSNATIVESSTIRNTEPDTRAKAIVGKIITILKDKYSTTQISEFSKKVENLISNSSWSKKVLFQYLLNEIKKVNNQNVAVISQDSNNRPQIIQTSNSFFEARDKYRALVSDTNKAFDKEYRNITDYLEPVFKINSPQFFDSADWKKADYDKDKRWSAWYWESQKFYLLSEFDKNIESNVYWLAQYTYLKKYQKLVDWIIQTNASDINKYILEYKNITNEYLSSLDSAKSEKPYRLAPSNWEDVKKWYVDKYSKVFQEAIWLYVITNTNKDKESWKAAYTDLINKPTSPYRSWVRWSHLYNNIFEQKQLFFAMKDYPNSNAVSSNQWSSTNTTTYNQSTMWNLVREYRNSSDNERSAYKTKYWYFGSHLSIPSDLIITWTLYNDAGGKPAREMDIYTWWWLSNSSWPDKFFKRTDYDNALSKLEAWKVYQDYLIAYQALIDWYLTSPDLNNIEPLISSFKSITRDFVNKLDKYKLEKPLFTNGTSREDAKEWYIAVASKNFTEMLKVFVKVNEAKNTDIWKADFAKITKKNSALHESFLSDNILYSHIFAQKNISFLMKSYY